MALISECELDPADQEGQRERFVRMLDVVPAGGKAVREPGAAISAGCPRRWPPWDCMSRAAASSPSAIRCGQVWTVYLLPSRFQARSRALRQAG